VVSQTGGHGDFRAAEHDAYLHCCGCAAAHVDALAAVVDGVDQVRAAVREELRRGATHIKIMASGGVASPNDPLERCQFADDEISAAVEEAVRWGAYAVAHCHPAEAIGRAVRLGVRSIEHATLVDEDTARMMASHNAFAVPTMATIFALLDDGPALGFPARSVEKLRKLGGSALAGLEIMKAAGVPMGFGTDLLGPHYVRQGTEFELRARVLPALEILRSATSINAMLLNQEGTLGCIRPGAAADLIVTQANPLEDISVLAKPDGASIAAVMRDGRFVIR
jgi:imidazolonepropionase-like amidohydrolase